ncbi:hypothetical protein LQV63_04225 [Paenibacillus profundus]|uniref:Uncharacterized protein n=1 Tax=Paenibacillus profundus TaxID=1173085 RepID=A0ABS8YDF0_9BACL|nr:hypothetical protein [Paenibacillus profundus]MCE5168520.1 hypothetical protein [Paenibacillus profundus]
MGYVTKNYSTGDKTVIGGELAVSKDGKITKDGKVIELVDKAYVNQEIQKLRDELGKGG